MLLASLHAITVSRGPKLREKCLNLCPSLPLPSILSNSCLLFPPLAPPFILYFLSPLPFYSTHDKGNLTEPGCRSSQVWKLFAATHCPRSLASSAFPSSLFSPLFIIIRFYRASRPETAIKRVGTLCSFDSVGGQFARHFSLLPSSSSFLHAVFAVCTRLSNTSFLQLLRPGTQSSRSNPCFPTRVLDEIGISRKEEGKRLFSFERIFFLSLFFL